MLGILIGLVIGSLIGAVFLRGGIFLANKVFKKDPAYFSQPKLDLPADFMVDEDPSSGNPFAKASSSADTPTVTDGNPYAAPTTFASPAIATAATANAIPEPDYGKAFAIVFVQGLIAGAINFAIGLVFGDGLTPSLAGLVVGFTVATIVYSLMIPTTAGRAAVICLFQMLLTLAVAALIGAVVFAVMAVIG